MEGKPQPHSGVSSTENANMATVDDWHRTLGHICVDKLKHMSRYGLVVGLEMPNGGTMDFCEACQFEKQTRKRFPHEASVSEGLLDLVHSDMCGPMLTDSLSGKRYILTFTDVFSRYSVVHFLKSKNEALE